MLSEQVRSVLADQSSFDRLRTLIDAGEEWDQPLWQQFSELGLLAASIPEDYGGLGLSDLDLGVISAELGRANAALPFFSTISLAANAIMHAGSDQQQEKWLPKFAEGEAIACVALGDAARGWLPSNPSVSFQKGKLHGETWPVFDAGIANLIVVLCQSQNGPILALAELDQPEITGHKLEGFDQLRAAYRIEFNGAEAELLGANDLVSEIADKAESILVDLGLTEKRNMIAGSLSRGDKRRLELAMSLVQDPTLLLLDEPTAGMSRADTNNAIDLLKTISSERNITTIIIEHDMHVVFSLAQRVSVLAQGHVIVEGKPDEIKGDPKVQEAYLGGAHL